MKSGEFWDHVVDIKSTSRRTVKQDRLGEIFEDYPAGDVGPATSLLTGDVTTPEESIGVGKKTMRKAIERSYDAAHADVREHEKELGSLTEVPLQLSRPNRLTDERKEYTVPQIVNFVRSLCEISSETQKIDTMTERLNTADNPHVHVYAILSERRDFPIGVSWKTVRDAAVGAFDVSKHEFERAYGVGTEISALISAILSNQKLRTKVEPLSRPRPMLASSADLPDDTSHWVADVKYDGGRLLIHRVSDQFMAQTRKRRDISDNLPEINEVDWPNASFVVDSEAVGYDPETGDMLPFQEFMERFQREKNIEEKAEDVGISFRLFDLLYWEGEDITRLDYDERRSILEQNFPEDLIATAYRDLEEAYETAIREGYEGIIAKKEFHTYEFQRDRAWRKMKPTKEEIDVRVTEIIPGTGRLAGTLGALRVETGDGVDLGKVGTGFTDAERDELWEKDDLIGSIIELEWEELQERDGEYGLRFPRYVGLRPDGDADDLDRIESL